MNTTFSRAGAGNSIGRMCGMGKDKRRGCVGCVAGEAGIAGGRLNVGGDGPGWEERGVVGEARCGKEVCVGDVRGGGERTGRI